MDTVCGGWSEPEAATKEIQQYCDQVKAEVESKTGKKFAEFKASVYRQQVVAGMNYLIKVQIGDSSYISIKIFVNLPCNGGGVVLSGVQETHIKDCPLNPF